MGFTTKTNAWMPCKLCCAVGNSRPRWLLMNSHHHLSQAAGVAQAAPWAQPEKNNAQCLRPSLEAWLPGTAPRTLSSGPALMPLLEGSRRSPGQRLPLFLSFSEMLHAHSKSQTSRWHPHAVPRSEFVLCMNSTVGREVGKGRQLHPSGLCRNGRLSLAARAASDGLSSCWEKVITRAGLNFSQVWGISAYGRKRWVSPSCTCLFQRAN